jgi:hypothetical protein
MMITLLVLDLLRAILVLFLLLYVLYLITNFYDERTYRVMDENTRLWKPFGCWPRIWKSAKELEMRHALLRKSLTRRTRRKLRNRWFAEHIPK